MIPEELIDKITCCDGLEGMRRLPPGSVPLVVTSPPWGGLREFGGHVFDQKTFGEFVDALHRVVTPGGVVCWDVQDQTQDGAETLESFRQALLFQATGFRVHQTVVVDIPSGHRMRQDNGMYPPHYVFVFSKGKPRTVNPISDVPNKWAGRVRRHAMVGTDGVLRKSEPKEIRAFRPRGPVWFAHGGGFNTTRDAEVRLHPGKMIEALVRDLITVWSQPGDLVLDPMAGSGTTCKMARLEGRRYVGFEIVPAYVGAARRRLKKYGGRNGQAV